MIARKPRVEHLEAEERNGVDDIVFPGGADGGQNGGHVVNTHTEEEQEAQQMTPDVHRLVGQDEEAAREMETRHIITHKKGQSESFTQSEVSRTS